ncbi:Hypothetical protein R9X50_00630900 [Acrodontium crateriforme]|uniref:Glutamyl-tRNA synthetase n=1 Tax=Acrodontium crateriforme TaxID=150365 RepID=A0AAQ3M8N0_9PEZI|nr:Hypothetical protein R9X50_00630900 [Acrodontium crateriforme]
MLKKKKKTQDASTTHYTTSRSIATFRLLGCSGPASFGEMTDRFQSARKKIYEAHDEDPNKHTTSAGVTVPYETHYAGQMEHYLKLRFPEASELLTLAVCGQHFRRWEVPRDSYPMTKIGYHSWRTALKKRQAKLVGEILEQCGYDEKDTQRCMALIEKEGLRQGEEEVQVLEDVACLVFLDDQFEEFKDKHDDEKIVNILKKTWVKMSEPGQSLALGIPMTDECKALVHRALAS